MALPILLAAAAATIGVTSNPCPIPPSAAAATADRDAYREARKTDWADLCHFHEEDLRLAKLPQSKRRVVFMGDSITEGWKDGDPSFYTHGWINRGISGQTSQQMLLRFPADVLALHPRVVHIMAGTNDVAGNTGPTTLDAIVGNIAAMVTLAKAAGIRVVLAAVPPAAKFGWAPDLKPAPVIAALNSRLHLLAARKHVTFVDYAPVLATSDGAMRDGLSLDGVHPNARGYEAMEPLTRHAVARANR